MKISVERPLGNVSGRIMGRKRKEARLDILSRRSPEFIVTSLAAPRFHLFVTADNGWPHNALRDH